MLEKIFVVRNKLGIHLRPAEQIAQLAGKFTADVSLDSGSCAVNGKSILGMLALEGSMGTEVTVITNGPDEREAMDAIERVFLEGFGEELGDL